MVPLSKRIAIEPDNLAEHEKESEQMIEKYQVKEAQRLDRQLQKECEATFAGLNESVVRLNSRLGKIAYIMGETAAAIREEETNQWMVECLCSQDYWLNIHSHVNLGLYYIALNDKPRMLSHILKAVYLMLLTYGETSPDLLVNLANLARIHQMHKEYADAIKCYKLAMKFVGQIYGQNHVKMSLCHSALAAVYCEMADVKMALHHQQENVAILKTVPLLLCRICPRRTPNSRTPSRY
jgi:tetratricopeptide (TPR) repeat protein